MNMYLIIMKENFGAINADDSSCHGYYVINFSSSLYTFQADLIIDVTVISSGEMVCEKTYLFQTNINSCYCFLQETKSINTIFL